MSRRRATVSSGVLLSLVVISGLAWSLFGWQDKPPVAPELLLPAKPVFLYTWDGFKAHEKAWQATGAQRALVETGLLEAIDKLLVFAVNEADEPVVELAHRGLRCSLERGASLAVAIDSSGPVLTPQALFIVHGGADFEPQLTNLLAKGPLQSLNPRRETVSGRQVNRVTLPNTPNYEFGWWSEGSHLMLAVGGNAVQGAINIADGKTPNLSSNPVFKTLRSAKDFEVASVSLIDIPVLLALVKNLDIPAIPESGKAAVPVADVLQALGVDRLGMIQGHWGFRGNAIWSESTILAAAPRTGVLALLNQQPFSLTDLPPLPKGCDHFSAFRLDFKKFNSVVLSLVNQGIKSFGPAGTPSVDDFLKQAQDQVGFHPLNDLVNTFGDLVVGFVDPSASALVPAAGVLIKVDDPDKLTSTLGKLEEKITEWVGTSIKFRTKEMNGRTIHIIGVGGNAAMFSPSWTIDKGWLVIGTTPQTVEAHVQRIDGKLPKWESPPEVAETLRQLPQKFVSFSYSDPRPGLRSVIAMASTGISLAELAMVEWRKQKAQSGKEVDDSVEFPISAEDVPVAEEVIAPLFPNISVGTIDATGLTVYSSTSLPGLPLPGSGGGGVESVAVVAVMVALLLPAVQQAREAARRSQSKNNLKQIGLAIYNYDLTTKHLPVGTHPNAKLKPEERLSWIVDILPYLDQANILNQTKLDKAWDDKANQPFLETNLPVLKNPSQPNVALVKGYSTTHYVGMAGIGKDAAKLPITDNRVGAFGYDRQTKFDDITDGVSNTILVTDAWKDFGPWAQGGPSTIRSLTTRPYINGPDGIGSPHAGGMQVLLGDGSVRFISKVIDPEFLEKLVTIHGGEQIPDF